MALPDKPTPDEICCMAPHVDHEMWRLLELGHNLRRRSRRLPDSLIRGLRVAYAGHARSLLEFFYDGRPGPRHGKRERKNSDIDVWLSDYLGSQSGTRTWEATDKARLYDADKLLGHLSSGRLSRTRLPSWGTRRDRRRFGRIIREVMQRVPNSDKVFPRTARSYEKMPGG